MWQYNNISELYHDGVKGMKWGHRKKIMTGAGDVRSGLGGAKSLGEISSRRNQVDVDNYWKKKTQKQMKNMNDKDLRDKVNRMNMEEQYTRLSQNKVAKGKNNLNDTLDVVGSVVTIGAGIAGVAYVIHELKSGG